MGLFRRLFFRLRSNVRYKLLLLGLGPVLLVMPVALIFAVQWGKNFGYDQLFIKVSTDLSVADDVFKRIQGDYLDHVARLAESFEFRTDLLQEHGFAVAEQIQRLKTKHSFSFLHLVDGQRRWLHESIPAGLDPRSLRSELVTRALDGLPGSGIEIFSNEGLSREGLAEEVRLPLLETPRAVPTNRTVEDRGMIIRVAYPIRDRDDQVIAVLDGGVLLNANFAFVDAIRDLVYGEGSLPKDSIGTVTVFLDDVRITTNVPLAPGERALGTRVSREVRDHVLARGEIWIDRAFVVNDWYISAYEPIFDVRGKSVGMLYAGFLEAPFRAQLHNALGLLIGLFIVLMGASSILAILAAKTIFSPVEAMARVVAATRRGENPRIGDVPSRDEIGELAREFDGMLDLLQERNQQIQLAADQLEIKVEERTAELKRRNAELSQTISVLRQTRKALVEAEKLAALGELTAGVAHEINNPTAVILGNLDVLVQELGTQLEPVNAEIELIIEQIYRIKDIINNLLQYARPAEYAGYVSEVDVNSVIEDTRKLVQHMIKNTHISMTFDYGATRSIQINVQELQQVFINLLVNAIHAVDPQRGAIGIRTCDWDKRGVIVQCRDNGAGIAGADLDKIFNPFFSTKEQGEGTGLGLSISYSLMRRYGGHISVTSDLGKGSTFSVYLLSEPEFQEDEATIVEQLAGTAPSVTGPSHAALSVVNSHT